MADGTFKVTVEADVAKIYADAEGNETDGTFDIPVDIGVFTKSPADGDFGAEHVLYLEKRTIDPATGAVEVIVSERPTHVGVDPYNKLIDRNSNDNIRQVDTVELLAAAGDASGGR